MGRRKIIVGVHGVGDQSQFETIQTVTRQFCRYYGVPGAVPLGRFHSVATAGALNIFLPEIPPDPALPDYFAFAEVYWADVPRSVVAKGYTLEESKRWARTLVDRVRANYPEDFGEHDYRAVASVLEKMIEAISVLEQLLFLAGKMGAFTFDLNKLFNDYLGDVQIVADYQEYCGEIVRKFADVMGKIGSREGDEIYIIAHSEGTVVSFLALLQAMSGKPETLPAWLGRVKGFMTIGSPIDKHLLLWPELWKNLAPCHTVSGSSPKIPWMNYYDFGDPIGYYLQSASVWLERHGCDAFTIGDFGYSRYPLPGKAHVDYWGDDYIFGHFISQVVDPVGDRGERQNREQSGEGEAAAQTAKVPGNPESAGVDWVAKEREFREPPGNRFWAHLLSYWASYGIVLLLQLSGVVLLYKNLDNVVGAGAQIAPVPFLRNALGLAALLAGSTASARIFCLTRKPRHYLLGCGVFLLSLLLYALLPEQGFRSVLGVGLGDYPTSLIVALAGVIVVLGTAIGRCWPAWGIRAFILFGGLAALGIVALILKGHPAGDTIWPVVPATAVFLYLWWLATLFFDLVFVWHLYIRHSQFLCSLDRFNEKKIRSLAAKG